MEEMKLLEKTFKNPEERRGFVVMVTAAISAITTEILAGVGMAYNQKAIAASFGVLFIVRVATMAAVAFASIGRGWGHD
mgnify:CR=1 FL=1